MSNYNNSQINKSQLSFKAKIGPSLKFLAKSDPRYDDFIKNIEKWGDSNSVLDIYSANIKGKTKYMLRLKNNVLDSTTVPINKKESVFMKKDLLNQFFELSEKSVLWAEDKLFHEVRAFASAGKPYAERLANIINSHRSEGIVFDAQTAKRFKEM